MHGLLSTLLSPFSVLEDVLRARERQVLLAVRPGLRGRLLRVAQILLLARRRCVEDNVGDRAAALAFSTLMSLVPLLLITLSLLSWLGYPRARLNEVESWIFATFVPEVAQGLRDVLLDTTETLHTASRSLGGVGVILLFLAASSLHGTLSRAFTRIWGPAGLLPSLARMAGFWATILVGPILVGLSLYLTAASTTIPVAASVLETGARLAGFAVAAFAAFLVLPGKRVRLAPAALGAVVAGTCFDLLNHGFAAYVRHTLVVSSVLTGLGIVPIFMLWLYFTWVTFLFGAECAFCAQEFDAALARNNIKR